MAFSCVFLPCSSSFSCCALQASRTRTPDTVIQIPHLRLDHVHRIFPSHPLSTLARPLHPAAQTPPPTQIAHMTSQTTHSAIILVPSKCTYRVQWLSVPFDHPQRFLECDVRMRLCRIHVPHIFKPVQVEFTRPCVYLCV